MKLAKLMFATMLFGAIALADEPAAQSGDIDKDNFSITLSNASIIPFHTNSDAKQGGLRIDATFKSCRIIKTIR